MLLRNMKKYTESTLTSMDKTIRKSENQILSNCQKMLKTSGSNLYEAQGNDVDEMRTIYLRDTIESLR